MGMRHALEADHLAAVASLSTRSLSRSRVALRGAVWGAGHTLTLLLFGGGFVLFGRTISPGHSEMLERIVGVMLVILGLSLLRRIHRDRLHVHVHGHDDGVVHVHAHRHAPDERHDPSHHHHPHPQGFPARALLVGMVHGLAGSAALVLLAASAGASPWLGIVYILVFGIGSIAGMAALSLVIAVPLELSARRLTRVHTALELLVAVGTMGLGAWTIYGG